MLLVRRVMMLESYVVRELKAEGRGELRSREGASSLIASWIRSQVMSSMVVSSYPRL